MLSISAAVRLYVASAAVCQDVTGAHSIGMVKRVFYQCECGASMLFFITGLFISLPT